jgi:hypothetical protein
MPTPEAAVGRFPLKGAALVAWQSQIHDACEVGTVRIL